MSYVNFSKHNNAMEKIREYAALQTEYGRGADVQKIADELESALKKYLNEIRALKPESAAAENEPDDYVAIRKLCAGGNKRAAKIPDLHNRMAGAVIGRFAGCTLGAPVEMWSVEDMKGLAEHNGMDFPPADYWEAVDQPWGIRYGVDARQKYTRGGMSGVPVDDDITYALLGLLIVEKYGFDFTTDDVGDAWKKLLPYACTAEDVALKNLNAGIKAGLAGETDNPYCQWIGAQIRADGFAYAAAGDPELAARMGYRDAYLSHRRNGIYGEMFFAAAIAAAFTVSNPADALKIALREIPSACALHKDIEWALSESKKISDYEQARRAVDARFPGMSSVHTNNNACLTVFGLILGKGNFTETISNVVAMGLDNDCTGATAGSIIGAIAGATGIDARWSAGFNDKVRSYINGYPEFTISDVVARFEKLAKQNMGK